MYVTLANLTLGIHVAFVAFVVLMVPAVCLGRWFHWSWVSIFWLRVFHLVGIIIVAAQAWAGLICPLTTLEMWLRRRGGGEAYSGGFVEHWMNELLYWEFPWWVFVVLYSLFALLVVATWIFVPPVRHKSQRNK